MRFYVIYRCHPYFAAKIRLIKPINRLFQMVKMKMAGYGRRFDTSFKIPPCLIRPSRQNVSVPALTGIFSFLFSLQVNWVASRKKRTKCYQCQRRCNMRCRSFRALHNKHSPCEDRIAAQHQRTSQNLPIQTPRLQRAPKLDTTSNLTKLTINSDQPNLSLQLQWEPHQALDREKKSRIRLREFIQLSLTMWIQRLRECTATTRRKKARPRSSRTKSDKIPSFDSCRLSVTTRIIQRQG